MGERAPCAFEGVTVRYGRTVACDDVSLSVQRGNVYALLGRNGAGKSSLIRCLLGHQRPATGRALLFGEDSWKKRTRAMRRVGVVPEQPDAPATMTARQLSRFCRPLYPRWDERQLLDRLTRAAVPDDTPFARLSRGQKQQVMLALALGHAPELLVLDDPTLGLDVVARKGLLEELIGELADRGTTVLVATHDLARFEGVATQIGILHHGTLLLDGELEGLKERFRRVKVETDDPTDILAMPELESCLRPSRHGWGIELVCDGPHDPLVAALGKAAPAARIETSDLDLEQIFEAVTADTPEQPS